MSLLASWSPGQMTQFQRSYADASLFRVAVAELLGLGPINALGSGKENALEASATLALICRGP